MKQNSDENDVVTKGFLRTYLKEEFMNFKDKFRDEMAGLIDRSEEKTTQKMNNNHNQVMTKLDHIVGELETIRNEQQIWNQHHDDLKAQVDSHEDRLSDVEKIVKN